MFSLWYPINRDEYVSQTTISSGIADYPLQSSPPLPSPLHCDTTFAAQQPLSSVAEQDQNPQSTLELVIRPAEHIVLASSSPLSLLSLPPNEAEVSASHSQREVDPDYLEANFSIRPSNSAYPHKFDSASVGADQSLRVAKRKLPPLESTILKRSREEPLKPLNTTIGQTELKKLVFDSELGPLADLSNW